MNTRRTRIRLTCPHCSASVSHGPEEMLQRLQSQGMLRREKHPDPDLVSELFRSTVGRLTCSACGRTGLTISSATDDFDDEAWGGGRRCASCGQPIPTERVRLLPSVKLCVTCQQKRESGGTAEPAEYCPKCGAVLQTRLRSGDGLARYQRVCPECRR